MAVYFQVTKLAKAFFYETYMSHIVTKPTKWFCAPSEDSDQPGHALEQWGF